jgi:hypothetical protein
MIVLYQLCKRILKVFEGVTIMTKYSSDELNEKIELLEKAHRELELCGGKIVPYIGWYWRKVDFDSKTYNFGIINEIGFKPKVQIQMDLPY